MKTWIGAALAVLIALPVAAQQMGDDGLYKNPWMRDTFKDLREDLDEANEEGKRLVLFFEQRGCIYCKKMHEEVFTDPEVSEFIAENYFVVQLNLHGSTEVTDFDGEVLQEREMARKWRVLFTPTIVFLPEDVPEGMTAMDAQVAVMPGAFSKGTSLDMFTWVAEKRYEIQDETGEDFQRYHARRIQERDNGKFD
ncbi:thioredoxin family protein [Mameliella alba]|uniref:thioredoxin family protein n=1 Tax=Mameliella alba TaxID=561184 RepID=UPI000B5348E9|nr:thioredoxin family protein [Mameliella alba]MBY6118208.1 thioredoxin family protein [Mameliella alba]OWV42346.1 thioredoxin [Mameliella alba]OWV56966.1 thioredoxin [Mameliella alba]